MSETTTLKVTGMKCGGCETNVNNKLKTLPGVESSVASSKDQEVKIEFDGALTDLKKISQAIAEAGYTVVD